MARFAEFATWCEDADWCWGSEFKQLMELLALSPSFVHPEVGTAILKNERSRLCCFPHCSPHTLLSLIALHCSIFCSRSLLFFTLLLFISIPIRPHCSIQMHCSCAKEALEGHMLDFIGAIARPIIGKRPNIEPSDHTHMAHTQTHKHTNT